MSFNKDIYQKIKDTNSFDGSFYELTLVPVQVCVCDGVGEALRVIIGNNDDVLVHITNDNDDETLFIPFTDLVEYDQLSIYKSIFSSNEEMSFDEFFTFIQSYLTGGDNMVVSFGENSDGDEDYDNLVYTIYGKRSNKIAAYYTKYEMLVKY